MFSFGGFIVAYNRPTELRDLLMKVFDQSFPPEIIWVIDSSSGLMVDEIVASMLDSRIKYYKVDHNSGYAGAAAKGLELCGKDGFNWIYWGSDLQHLDGKDYFERLLAIRDENPFAGVLGTVGQFFDRKKGVIKRIQTRLLQKKKVVEVDFVAGGMCMLVKKEVVQAGIAPDPELFFGFEELDFCLTVQRRGFKVVVDSGLFLEARELHNRLDFEKPRYQKKSNLNREYYSLRNLLMISDKLTLSAMKRQLIKRWLAKSIYGFRFGPIYGVKNFKLIALAFNHYRQGITGKTIDIEL